jgi:hypothetical protein
MRRLLLALFLVVLFAPVAPGQPAPPAQLAPAQAAPQHEDPDNFLVGWYGWHFANGIEDVLAIDEANPKTMGVSYGFFARSWVSGELDFGYSKDYFGDPDFLGGNNLMTLTGSVVVGPWLHITDSQIIRPYGIFGGGLARSEIEAFVQFGKTSRNRGVIDYGGGVMVYFIRNFGVRADIRIMRDVGSDSSDKDGWGITETTYRRFTVGAFVAF